MQDKNLTITIAGTPGSGKTTIGILINRLLIENGYDSILIDEDYEPQNDHLQPLREEALKDELNITITTQYIKQNHV